MSALSGCKKLLTIANLLNIQGIQLIGYHVPNKIVDFILITPLITMGIFSLILCFENQSYGLFAISSSISIFIGSLSAGAIYVCLAAKTKNLIELFGSLGRSIKRRESLFYSIFVLFRSQFLNINRRWSFCPTLDPVSKTEQSKREIDENYFLVCDRSANKHNRFTDIVADIVFLFWNTIAGLLDTSIPNFTNVSQSLRSDICLQLPFL